MQDDTHSTPTETGCKVALGASALSAGAESADNALASVRRCPPSALLRELQAEVDMRSTAERSLRESEARLRLAPMGERSGTGIAT